jgi:anti-sigma factor RsiW
MTCSRTRAWLQLYVDGQLHPRHLARLEEHMETCGTCRADLALLELICQGASGLILPHGPAELTDAIMHRIAELEARRASLAGQRLFAPGWGDAVLAAILATLATAVFLIFQPALWQTSSSAVLQALTPAGRALISVYPSWPSWVAWLVWVGIGLVIAIGFAGSEVRANWRRGLLARLPH